jgi:hypothetical protein
VSTKAACHTRLGTNNKKVSMPRAFLVFIFVLIRPSIMRANNSIDSARWIPLGWYDFTQSASSRTGRNSFRAPHSCVCRATGGGEHRSFVRAPHK